MSVRAISIRFEDTSAAEASQLAQDLHEYILDFAPKTKVSRQRGNDEDQLAGEQLWISLASHAVLVLLIEAIKTWWESRRRGELGVVIKTLDGMEVRIDRSTPDLKKSLEVLYQNDSLEGQEESAATE
jgi:hypothetical protein